MVGKCREWCEGVVGAVVVLTIRYWRLKNPEAGSRQFPRRMSKAVEFLEYYHDSERYQNLVQRLGHLYDVPEH